MSLHTEDAQVTVARDADWEADPEGYTPLHSPLPAFDLSGIVTGQEDAVHELRAQCLPYLHSDFTIAPQTTRCFHTGFSQGGRGLIVLLAPPSVPPSSRGNVSFKLTKDLANHGSNHADDESRISGLFGPRVQPYAQLHAGLGNETLLQERGMTQRRGEFLLAVLSILGPAFEGLFNGVAYSRKHFHAQYILRTLPIFDVKYISDWPIRALRESFPTIPDAANWMKRTHDTERRLMRASDFLFRCDTASGMPTYTVICVPREEGATRLMGYFGVDHQYESLLSLFRPLGALDIGGYCVAPQTEHAFDVLVESGDLYESALRQLST